jgi:hypothetical protein
VVLDSGDRVRQVERVVLRLPRLDGSTATVRDTLRDYRAAMGFGNLLTMLQFGTMPGEMTAQNQRRFAEGVIKPLRAEAAAMAAQ